MSGETYTWAEASKVQSGLPSYRKVDHWCRQGALGKHHIGNGAGTGNQRRWTRRELRILAAIQVMADDLNGLCIELIPGLLVKRVWQVLNETDWTVLNSGGARIIAQLTMEDGTTPITVAPQAAAQGWAQR